MKYYLVKDMTRQYYVMIGRLVYKLGVENGTETVYGIASQKGKPFDAKTMCIIDEVEE